MRKFPHVVTYLLILLTASCGTTAPTAAPDLLSPASLTGPETGASPISSSPSNISYSQNIRFEQLSLEDGLSQSAVNVILQDRKGFLWIGTEDGLNRYDGYNFKVYKPDAEDPNSLSDRWITSLVEDKDGFLWIGTRLGGLNRYNPITGEFTRYLHDESNENGIGSNKVTALEPDQHGIWVGTDNSLDFMDFETETFKHYRALENVRNSLSSSSISDLFMDSNGALWIGTSNAGLNLYNRETDSFKIYKSEEENSASLSDDRISSITEGEKGELWIGAANGLTRFDTTNKRFTRYLNSVENPNSLGSNNISVVYRDRSGGLWIGTDEGLDRYDAASRKFIHHRHQPSVSNSLANNMIGSIYEDRSDVLWVGTFGSGLNKYNRQQDKFAYYRYNPNDPNSLSGDFVFPIVIDSNSFVWIGTNGAGLNRFNPITKQFVHYQHDPSDPQSIGSNDIIALRMDHNTNLWVGTNRGLDLLNYAEKTFTHFQVKGPDQNTLAVFSIFEDAQNALWVGTDRGIYIFDSATQSLIRYQRNANDAYGFEGNQINFFIEDNDRNLWVGTFEDGLKRINPQRNNVVVYKNDPANSNSLGNDSIMCIYQDHNGSVWVGTAGGGLNRYNPETDSFTRFTEKEGLPNDVIYGILEDDNNNLWISANFGLSRFNTETQTFRNFTASDGLQSNEFNQNSFAKDSNGTMYFGGINGLNVFLPGDIKDNPYPPPISITSLTQDGQPLVEDQTAEYLQEIALKWPRDSFEFEFAAFAYGQPSKNQYAYKLEGFDSNWNELKNKRNGRYTNLPGGDYTLRLRGSNSDGVWNEQGQAIKIVVVPPFWETLWFRAFFLISLGAAIVGGMRWRVKSVERRAGELERIVQKRTADLEKRTTEIDALYQADEKILRNVTLNQVFQTLVDVSVSMLKADRSVVFAWNEEKHKILPRVSHGFREDTLFALNFEEGEGFVGQAMKTGEPVIVSDLHIKDLRGDIQTVIRREGIQSFAHFPIVIDGKVLAIFNVGYTRPNALNEDNIRLFSALVQRASLSIANMQLFEQTKDLAVMEERNRLARDLHDSAKQKAFAALAQLGTVNGLINTKPNEIKPHLSEAETLVYEVIQELTFLIQEIYPFALQEKGLPTTLREYIYEWENRNDAVVNLTVQNERKLPLETEQAVYRVIQEALANVSRHSKAKRAEVSLVYNVDSLQITIADNGCGFDMDQKAKGMGFRSMRERIGTIRGTLQVQSAPGQGTRVITQLPIKNGTGA